MSAISELTRQLPLIMLLHPIYGAAPFGRCYFREPNMQETGWDAIETREWWRERGLKRPRTPSESALHAICRDVASGVPRASPPQNIFCGSCVRWLITTTDHLLASTAPY